MRFDFKDEYAFGSALTMRHVLTGLVTTHAQQAA